MSAYEIPLTPQPQSFSIDLLGTEYRLTLAWCGQHEAWMLDIATTGGLPIVQGIPLVCGVDLLGQYAYLGLPGKLYVQDLSDVDSPPNFDNLGVNSLLFLVAP